MSLAIETDDVLAVMIGGKWFEVWENTFDCDAYEFVHQHPQSQRHDAMTIHGGGNGGVCSTGYYFRISKERAMSGPLTAVQAVRYKR